MSGFGDKLRREREMRGVSLEEIAESTKIGTRSLRALEDEDFEKLPGGIFNRGFVRAYSRFLGLDEEQTVVDFDAAWKAHQAAKAPPPQLDVEEKEEPEKSSSGMLLLSTVILMVVVAAGWFLVKRQNANFAGTAATQSSADTQPNPKQTSPQSEQPSVTPATSSTISQNGTEAPAIEATKPGKPEMPKAASKSPGPTPEKPQQGADTSSEVSPDANAPIYLEVFAREDSWISVSVDGKSLGQGILPAQKIRTIRAQREVHIRVGNVAGVEVSFNGRPINIDGEPKQVRELIFTPEGLRQ